ncbi:RNA polymerase sigma factor CarQ [Enhygromyxa salina]|uniref:RNA polymerase sigma factor CarQ n=2 Tax=Enhygromyxa salina TaxID=215803 RepID=A0A2S9XCJ6_9BACT|nr:RNA polymerase sigma factor CarQ [Enhygromyxa salina]
MERYGDGDPRAFAALHGALSPRLRGFLMKLVRDEPTVDDLLQLTFLKAHLARDRFCLQGGDPDGAVQGWYFAIARNVAMDHLRKRGRQERRRVDLKRFEDGPATEFVDDAVSIEDRVVGIEHSQEVVDRVRDAIALLPEGQREVVELHKLRGMSMAEVAQRLEIREGAARVRAHRGYKALARMLGTSGSVLLFWIWAAFGLGGGN